MSWQPLAKRAGQAALAIALWLVWSTACGTVSRTPEVRASWALDPASPALGQPTRAILTLRTAEGQLVRGARLRLEAHMTHPGMAPVVASVQERSDGLYEADLKLTMAGSWTLVASGALPDGTRLTTTYDLENIK